MFHFWQGHQFHTDMHLANCRQGRSHHFLKGVTTLQGRLVTRLGEALERSSGMTLSRKDSVLSDRVRSVRQRKAIP